MNILIINQPVGNRGDESAHRALVRQIGVDYPNDSITVLFFGEKIESITPIQVEAPNIQYVVIPFKKGKIRLARMAFSYHAIGLLVSLIPAYYKVDQYIRRADKVICAPGGICLGRFLNWDHLLWLVRTRHYHKSLAYYSRSFGPFDSGSKYKDLFREESISILRYMDFMSIRDRKSMDLADELNLKYIESIDTAFLENPQIDITFLRGTLTNDYVVFVPNSLVWQPAFSLADSDSINEFYLAIMKLIRVKFPNSRIVMMPQLFGQGIKNDGAFFEKLKKLSNDSNTIVLPDVYSSDIQQTIIKGSHLVIGARYHSIVFAINNERPFVSLSYEHKMFGLLSILGLDDRQVDVTTIGTSVFSSERAIKSVESIMEQSIDLTSYRKKSHEIALNCYNHFTKWLNKEC
jgi:colanic acid/amylovoran biosynthesis protein